MGGLALNARTTDSLLNNFERMFRVNHAWIEELRSSLIDRSSSIVLIFVDLDNVPRFFERVNKPMLARLPFEVFIVCSARSTRHIEWRSTGRMHFSLANPTKDAADAVCAVAAAKLDSILVGFNRQGNVPLVTVSDDKIFQQVL